MTLRVTVPTSYIDERFLGRPSCPKCGELLMAPECHNLSGSNRIYSGQPLEAIPKIEHAMRLDPALSPQFLHFLGMAYLLAGKYETAATLLRQRIVLVPRTDFSRALLASAGRSTTG